MTSPKSSKVWFITSHLLHQCVADRDWPIMLIFLPIMLVFEKHLSLYCFSRCCGIIDLGSLTHVPRDLFLPFGGFLSTFCLQDYSEEVGLCKQSKTDFTVPGAYQKFQS